MNFLANKYEEENKRLKEDLAFYKMMTNRYKDLVDSFIKNTNHLIDEKKCLINLELDTNTPFKE